MEDTYLSQHFRLSEFTRSATASARGIDNTPSASAIDNLRRLCQEVLEPLRRHLDRPVVISSGYRCKKLNDRVGGSKNSQHTKGQAADIASDAPIHLAQIVIDRGLDFDQMILYPNFIHLSYTLERANRKQILYSKDYYGPKLESL